MVECSTGDGGVASSSLTDVTALCPSARHINPSLVLVQPRKTHPGITKQDQTLLWTCVAGARRCVNSRYAKFKYTGMKSDYIQISQCNLQ